MKQQKILKIEMVFLLLVLILPFVSSAMRSNPQYTQFMGTQGGEFDESMCQQGQDFLIQIAPFGCTPAVVRSDLLEEQNVPVYCQLGATKINPLIDVEAIEGIKFSGEIPEEVAGMPTFHPARAALNVQGDLTNPILNNIGYAVIVLKKQANASAMPDYVSGNLTARIKYDVKNAFGIGKANFYLPEMTDNEWEIKKSQYSFWSGKGSLRVESIEEDRAVISIYSGDNKISSVSLNKGEESGEIYLPGFECSASLQIKLNSLENPDTRALLSINADIVEVAEGEKFLENKCRIISLRKQGLVQKVKIRCTEDDGVNSFNLMISPKVNLSIKGDVRDVGLGEWLYDHEVFSVGEFIFGDDELITKSVYVAYIGTRGESRNVDDLFVFLVSTPEKKSRLSESELARYNTLVGELLTGDLTGGGIVSGTSEGVQRIAGGSSLFFNFIARGEDFHWINYGDESEKPFESEVIVNGFSDPQDIIFGKDTEEYYELAVEDYETVIESFSGERYPNNMEGTLDEKALYQRGVLAYIAGQKATFFELCDEFKFSYPDSTRDISECDEGHKLSSQEISVGYVTINGKSKEIIFDGIYEPSTDDYSVKIFVSDAESHYNGEKTLRKNKNRYLSDNESIFLKELEEDYAIFDVSNVNYRALKERLYDPKNLKIELGEYEIIGVNKYKISLEEINLKKSAKVTLSPGFKDSGTEASFGFNIGIEKRLFELSPDKIKEKIERLSGELNKWQNFSNKLANVVKGLKGACFSTGVALTVKNFLANTGGAGIARKYVMRGSGGWYEQCADKVNDQEYISRERCLIGEAENIERDVSKLSELINEQNEIIQELEEGNMRPDTMFGPDVVDTEQFMRDYSAQVIDSLDDETIANLGGIGDPIDIENMMISLNYSGWQNRNYNREQLREIELYASVLGDAEASPELEGIAERELYSVLLEVQENAGEFVERSTVARRFGIDPRKIGLYETDEMQKIVYEGLTYGDIKGETTIIQYSVPNVGDAELESNTPVQFMQYQGETYILVLGDFSGTDLLPIRRLDQPSGLAASSMELSSTDDLMIYDINGNLIENLEQHISLSELRNIYFQVYDSASYENQYKNAELSYYETEPYKGLPAIVPFDLDNGWYVAIKQTLPVFGNIGAYTAAGAANSVWLGNVGENGLEENLGGDDIYQMINLGTRQPMNEFPGLNEDEAERIIDDAETAIQQASNQRGSRRVNILGQGIDVGAPAVNLPDIECTDLMSVKDCQLLFNVCDPVICPSSRCDLGGAYPVRDVIQTGIIGSLALCLPNIQEGILMPVCLTGVQAGIDGWLSVKTSYRDCLQNALDTGEMVGICDEIYSIYACEFFWRQALPLADLSIPKIVGALMGQNIRGGGEYLSVENAWTTAKDSATYFTQYYGASANKAFKARTTEEVGTEICKLSVSAVYARGVDIIDTLAEPDSPSQFHGRFDEIPFSSVTVPPTSHYKVFYHIYAGKDSGAYYQVYLKGIPGSSYYQDTSSTLMIASGYIETGGYASETRDLTEVSGYQQLCINVNGQEECGFSEVSSSFAIDYISDSYVAWQVKNVDIKTESKCISGGSVGIIRICGTDNPGKGSDGAWNSEDSRWKQVGYCGAENILCWLDTESVEDAIDISTIEEDALENVTQNYLDILREQEGYLTEDQFVDEVEKINREKDDAAQRLTLIEEIFDKVFLNNEKAYLFLLRGDAYAELAWEAWKEEMARREAEAEAAARATEDAGEGEEVEDEIEVETEELFEYAYRYERTKDLFEKYSEVEDLPEGWTAIRFRSLLVAIAIRQSYLGYPDGENYDPRWIMEYGWSGRERIERYICSDGVDVEEIDEEEVHKCAENQIKDAANILKLALKKMNIANYRDCNDRSNSELHLRCVLSVYLTGEKSRRLARTVGEKYADEVMDFMEFLEKYFS